MKLIVNKESAFKTAFAEEMKKELEAIGIKVQVRRWLGTSLPMLWMSAPLTCTWAR